MCFVILTFIARVTDALQIEDKEALVQGLARIVAVLPPEEAAAASMTLVTPLLRTCQLAIQRGMLITPPE